MRIERIEKSKHKQERVLVFLEGGDLLRITGAELLRFGLYKGMDVPPELVVELQAAAQKSELKQTAARMASSVTAPSTTAVPAARSTVAFTPGRAFSAFSTWATQ